MATDKKNAAEQGKSPLNDGESVENGFAGQSLTLSGFFDGLPENLGGSIGGVYSLHSLSSVERAGTLL